MNRRRRAPEPDYGLDYMHDLRWRYRSRWGEGTETNPYRGGGSFGRGYQRATDLGFRAADSGPPRRQEYAAPYYDRHPGGVRFAGPGRGPRTRPRVRRYDYGYPYFGSTAITEAVQGYPPADTLNPEIYPSPLGWGVGDYGEAYEPPWIAAERRRARRMQARGGGRRGRR